MNFESFSEDAKRLRNSENGYMKLQEKIRDLDKGIWTYIMAASDPKFASVAEFYCSMQKIYQNQLNHACNNALRSDPPKVGSPQPK